MATERTPILKEQTGCLNFCFFSLTQQGEEEMIFKENNCFVSVLSHLFLIRTGRNQREDVPLLPKANQALGEVASLVVLGLTPADANL